MLQSVIDALIPESCLACGKMGECLCGQCWKKLRPIPLPVCFYCNRLSYGGWTHEDCRRPDGVDGGCSLYFYNDTLRRVIHQIKYGGRYAAIQPLISSVHPDVLAHLAWIGKTSDKWRIQPIPLHPARLRLRGFNQAEKLGEALMDSLTGYQTLNYIGTYRLDCRSRAQTWPVSIGSNLTRNKPTPHQAELSGRVVRMLNMSGAFRVCGDVRGVNIMLVDDVITTGSTVREAAKQLKRNGASIVYAVSLARD